MFRFKDKFFFIFVLNLHYATGLHRLLQLTDPLDNISFAIKQIKSTKAFFKCFLGFEQLKALYS